MDKSNQTALANGCVCDSGCAACGRLAEAFGAMREALRECQSAIERHTDNMSEANWKGSLWAEPWEQARAALALADKVSR